MTTTTQPHVCLTCGAESRLALTSFAHATGYGGVEGGICESCLAARRAALDDETRKQTIRRDGNTLAHIVARRVGMCGLTTVAHDRRYRLLTDAERREVMNLWATMPGDTCWADAFSRWLKQ